MRSASKIHDLRSYIACLEAASELARVKQPVSLKYELANVGAALERKQGPAPLFERLVEMDNRSVFSSAVAIPRRTAIALGCALEDVNVVLGEAMEPARGVATRRVSDAPWKRHVVKGDAVDIRTLPIPTHAAHDGGPFITAGITVSRDPDDPTRGNLGYNRYQVLGPRTFGMNIIRWRDVGAFLAKTEERNQPLPVAIAVGLDPAIMIAAGVRTPHDELQVAGALRGAPVEVSPGVTVDLDIPAHAEWVIEGFIPPHVRRPEGPLAEFHGYYGELWDSPTVEVTAICHRDDAIWQTIIPGWAEHIYIGNVLPREPMIMKYAKHIAPTVKNVHIPPCANGFMVVVQMAKDNPGQPRNAAMAVFAAHMNPRVVVVVDPDVDIYDPADVTWALINRVDWGRDIFTVPGAQNHQMDWACDNLGVGTKAGIDATYKPERRDYIARVTYPPVDLARYLA